VERRSRARASAGEHRNAGHRARRARAVPGRDRPRATNRRHRRSLNGESLPRPLHAATPAVCCPHFDHGGSMKLEGSCHCGAVHFTVESHTPYPFMRCYCSICRKTAGGGGYAINIMGDARTLTVRGGASLAIYRARLVEPGKKRSGRSQGQRHFCVKCASALWVADPRWPEWVYTFA